MDNVETEVRKLIAEILEADPNSIDPNARLVEDLGMDSMMALEILVAMEKKYKIHIPEEKLAELKTLSAAVAVAREYQNTSKDKAV